MATLSAADRAAATAQFQRTPDCPGVVTKAQLRAAIDAIDDWVEENAASFNLAIPQPARGALSARQKAGLLNYVVTRRFEVG